MRVLHETSVASGGGNFLTAAAAAESGRRDAPDARGDARAARGAGRDRAIIC